MKQKSPVWCCLFSSALYLAFQNHFLYMLLLEHAGLATSVIDEKWVLISHDDLEYWLLCFCHLAVCCIAFLILFSCLCIWSYHIWFRTEVLFLSFTTIWWRVATGLLGYANHWNIIKQELWLIEVFELFPNWRIHLELWIGRIKLLKVVLISFLVCFLEFKLGLLF